MNIFLLNIDGSYPNGLSKGRLDELGLTAVLPTKQPVPEPGMQIEETEPVFIDGVYQQCWRQVPVVQPSPKPLVELKAEVIKEIEQGHAQSLLALTGNPTQAEQTTWAGKVVLAEAIQSGAPLTLSQQAFMSANGITEETKAAYAKVVIEKSAAYWSLVGIADKVRSDCKARVMAAQNYEELAKASAANLAQHNQTMAAVSQRMRV